MSSFNVISSIGETTLKIRRSTFTGWVSYCSSVGEMKALLSQREELHSRATHNCWAYIVGDSGETSHYSDCGEPSGSAGRPMYNSLLSNNLTNVVAVVTRYYGGVKLGVRGLIDAYGEAVDAALAATTVKKFVIYRHYKITIPYPVLDTFWFTAKKHECEEVSADYGASVSLEVQLPVSNFESFELYLTTLKASSDVNYQIVDAV